MAIKLRPGIVHTAPKIDTKATIIMNIVISVASRGTPPNADAPDTIAFLPAELASFPAAALVLAAFTAVLLALFRNPPRLLLGYPRVLVWTVWEVLVWVTTVLCSGCCIGTNISSVSVGLLGSWLIAVCSVDASSVLSSSSTGGR